MSFRELREKLEGKPVVEIDPAVLQRMQKRKEARENPMAVKYGLIDDPRPGRPTGTKPYIPGMSPAVQTPYTLSRTPEGDARIMAEGDAHLAQTRTEIDKFNRATTEGWGNSISGMVSSGVITEEQSTDLNWYHTIYKELVTMAGDAPVTVPTGVAAGVASGGNPIVAAAAGSGAEGFVKAFIIEAIRNGVETPEDITRALMVALKEGAKGAAMGAAVGGTGKLIRGGLSAYGSKVANTVAVPSEVTVGAAVSGLMNGGLQASSFRDAALSAVAGYLGNRSGLHVVGKTREMRLMHTDRVAHKLMLIQQQTGIDHLDVVQMAGTDRILMRQLMSDDPGIPERLINDGVRQKIESLGKAPEERPLKEDLKTGIREAERHIVNDLAPIKHLMKDHLEGHRPWSKPDGNVYQEAVGSRGYMNKVDVWMNYGGYHPVTGKDYGSKGLLEIASMAHDPKSNKDLEGFAEYLTSRTAMEREGRFFTQRRGQRKELRDLKREAALYKPGTAKRHVLDQKIKSLEGAYDKSRFKRDNDAYTGMKELNPEMSAERGKDKYGEAAKEFWALQDDILKMRRDFGLLSEDSLKNIIRDNAIYSPMKRLLDKNGQHLTNESGEKLYAFEGSDRPITNPLDQTAVQIQQTILAGQKNRWINNMYKTFGHNPDAMKKADNLDSAMDTARKSGDIVTPEMLGAVDNGDKTYMVTAYENGTPIKYQVNKGVYNAYNAFGQAGPRIESTAGKMIDNVVRSAAVSLRIGATSTPTFMAANTVKDMVSGKMLSPNGGSAIMKYLDGLKSSVTRDADRVEAMKFGAGYAGRLGMELSEIDSHMYSNMGDYYFDNVVDTGKLKLRKVLETPQYIEGATRQGEYKRARSLGKNPVTAAYDYRMIGGDFNMAGKSGRWVNRYSAFWNMRIQGIARQVESFKDDPVGWSARKMAYTVLPALSLKMGYDALIGGTFDDDLEKLGIDRRRIEATREATMMIRELPRHDTDMNFVIPWARPARDAYGTILDYEPMFARIPKSHDEWAVASLTERCYEAAIEKDPRAFKGLWNAVNENYGSGIAKGVVPDIFEPFFGWQMNYDTFRDRHIVSPYLEDASAQYQYNDHTSELSKRISNLLARTPLSDVNMVPSPVKLDYLIEQWTAGIGRLGNTVLDKSFDFMEGKENLEASDPDWLKNVPLARAFISRRPGMNARSVSDFLERYSKYEQMEKDAELAMTRGDYDLYFSIVEDPKFIKLGNLYQAMRTMRSRVYQFHGWDRKVYGEDVPANEIRKDKREMIEETVKLMIQTASLGLEIYDEFDKRYEDLKKEGELYSTNVETTVDR